MSTPVSFEQFLLNHYQTFSQIVKNDQGEATDNRIDQLEVTLALDAYLSQGIEQSESTYGATIEPTDFGFPTDQYES